MTMKNRTARMAACLASLFISAAVHAAGTSHMSVDNGWVRWLPNNLPAAGYMTIHNNGDKPVDLTDASSPDYGSVMLHETITNGSTSTMEMVDKVTVPAHGIVNVTPGGYHFMLEEAKHKIAPGDTIKLKLQFSDGTTLDTLLTVKSPANVK
ncbi:MAG TPA: copper chaperone PCu(A)C [Trinickia sp.]|uniref:copper chaperone PCu(A)C n=1 Tax=Trinickia sp. TaxID=2571163 RepID=UPI002BE346FE|nr:copper chaperone PCu(A)C [Trinickia sp.]HTI19027.1 copper chaperone PCu(A)C [Trinickia sp.]